MAESEETGLERQSLSALGSVSGSPVASDSDGESTSSFEIIEDPENPSVSRSSLILAKCQPLYQQKSIIYILILGIDNWEF